MGRSRPPGSTGFVKGPATALHQVGPRAYLSLFRRRLRDLVLTGEVGPDDLFLFPGPLTPAGPFAFGGPVVGYASPAFFASGFADFPLAAETGAPFLFLPRGGVAVGRWLSRSPVPTRTPVVRSAGIRFLGEFRLVGGLPAAPDLTLWCVIFGFQNSRRRVSPRFAPDVELDGDFRKLEMIAKL